MGGGISVDCFLARFYPCCGKACSRARDTAKLGRRFLFAWPFCRSSRRNLATLSPLMYFVSHSAQYRSTNTYSYEEFHYFVRVEQAPSTFFLILAGTTNVLPWSFKPHPRRGSNIG